MDFSTTVEHAAVLAAVFGLALFPLLRYGSVQSLPFRKKKIGPTYWGHYGGTSALDSPEEETIELRKPSNTPAV
jgi:hypothetical protein